VLVQNGTGSHREKFQAPNTKNQTNPNYPNSKFQTSGPLAVMHTGVITVSPGLAKRCDAIEGECFGH
jgi:hypothetical protein